MMYYFYMFFSLASDCAITVENRLVRSLKDVWRPILIFPLLFIGCVIIHVIIISIISLFVNRKKECTKMNNIFRRVSIQTLDLVMHIMRVKLHITGEDKLPEDKRFLLIGNHLSVFDPMIAMRVFSKKEVAFVSKKENIKMPFFGRLMLASGCLSLDRDNNRSAVKTISKASAQISDGIASMGIYPEGGINKTDRVLLPFHSGSFKIAQKSKAPIVVTTIRNTEKLFKRFLFSSTDVYLDIIGVLQHEEYSSMKTREISDKVWNIMYDHLSQNCVRISESKEREAAC